MLVGAGGSLSYFGLFFMGGVGREGGVLGSLNISSPLFSYFIAFLWPHYAVSTEIVFFVGVWSWLADKLFFILSNEVGSWILKVHPPFFQEYSICNNARLISTQFFLPCFDPNEWCLKNGLRNGELNPQPLSHESSALTTIPRLLAKHFYRNGIPSTVLG